VQRASNPRPSG